MTAVPTSMFTDGRPASSLVRAPYWDAQAAGIGYGLHCGASVTYVPSGSTEVQVGSVAEISGGQPWNDGSYVLDCEAIIFDPTAIQAGVWIRQKVLFVRRSNSLIMSAQFNEFVIPGNASTVLNTSVPDNHTINLLITSHLSGGKVCARWVLEHVGNAS